MNRRRWSFSLVVALGAASGCGGDDTASTPEAAAVAGDAEVPGGSEDDAAAGGPGTPEIDPAAMPGAGDAQFVVEGATYEFGAADAAESAYSCTVSPDSVVVELQLRPGAMLVQANRTDGEPWQGSVTISPAGADRIYFSTPGFDGTFAVEGSMAVYEGNFSWRTSDDPARREDAGTGTVRMSC